MRMTAQEMLHGSWMLLAPTFLILGTVCNLLAFIVSGRKVFQDPDITLYVRYQSAVHCASLWSLYLLMWATDITNPHLTFLLPDLVCKITWFLVMASQPLENWIYMGFQITRTLEAFNKKLNFEMSLSGFYKISIITVAVMATPTLLLVGRRNFAMDVHRLSHEEQVEVEEGAGIGISERYFETVSGPILPIVRDTIFTAARQCAYDNVGDGLSDKMSSIQLFVNLYQFPLPLATSNIMLLCVIYVAISDSTNYNDGLISCTVWKMCIYLFLSNFYITYLMNLLFFLGMAGFGYVMLVHVCLLISCVNRSFSSIVICYAQYESKIELRKLMNHFRR